MSGTLARAVDNSLKNKFCFELLDRKVKLNFTTFSFYRIGPNQQINWPKGHLSIAYLRIACCSFLFNWGGKEGGGVAVIMSRTPPCFPPF